MILPMLAITMIPPQLATELYVGTYTDATGSKGIYRVTINLESGELSPARLVAEATAPSYLALHPNRNHLYAVNEFSDGEATAYAIEDDRLRKLNSTQFKGRGPCHVAIDPKGRWLLVSAYGAGSLAVLPVEVDGKIGQAVDVFQNQGSGPDARRQDASHVHFAAAVGDHIYACDLGTDEVLAFQLSDGKLKSLNPRSAKTNPGAGPRHLVAHPNGSAIYANNEMALSVSVFERDPRSGDLKLTQTIGTLPEPERLAGTSTAAIRLHPRLPVLYVSNRGDNSITVFDILPSGKLSRRTTHPLDVQEPRDFHLHSSGSWMVAAGQKSGDLVSIPVDPKSGDLGKTSSRTTVPKPVCVLFR